MNQNHLKKKAIEMIKDILNKYKKVVETALDKFIPKEDVEPVTIHKAMRYSLFAGGKRIRPVLALMACQATSQSYEKAVPFACAIEMIHTYSLIHDDLPAMDDDDLRRGKPTSHKVYGEGIAILAGDALLTHAFEILALVKPGEKGARLCLELSQASGTKGMIGGQVFDLEGEDKAPEIEYLKKIHRHKTGALLTVPLVAGAISGDASEEQIENFRQYGELIGIQFQVIDDILDIISDEETMGKATQKDADKNKMTYPATIGLEKSRIFARDIMDKAIEAAKLLPDNGPFIELSRYLGSRID